MVEAVKRAAARGGVICQVVVDYIGPRPLHKSEYWQEMIAQSMST